MTVSARLPMHLRAGEPDALTWSAGSVLLQPGRGRTKARPVSRQPDQYAVRGRRVQIRGARAAHRAHTGYYRAV